MPGIWKTQLSQIVIARLNIMQHIETNPWTVQIIAGGAYFFRTNWMNRFNYGGHHFPAFHLTMDIPAHASSLDCRIRLEESYRNPNIVVPQQISNIFLPIHRHDVGFRGGVNWVFDNCVTQISLPAGFQRNVLHQTLPIGLWQSIEDNFFRFHHATLQSFVEFD